MTSPGDNSGRQFIEHLAEALVEDRHHLVDLLGGRDERGAEGDPVGVEAAEEAIAEGAAADLDAEGIGEAFLRAGVADELDGLEEPLAADVADDTVPFRQ